MRSLILLPIFFFGFFSFAQESNKKRIHKLSFELSLSASKGFIKSYQSSSITGIVAGNSQTQGAQGICIGVGYQLNMLGFDLNYEYGSYLVENKKGVLFITGKEYRFDLAYPQYGIVSTLNDPLAVRYGQNTFLLGLHYEIKWKFLSFIPILKGGILQFTPPDDRVFMKALESNYTQEVYFQGETSLSSQWRAGLTIKHNLYGIYNLFIRYEYSYSALPIKYKIIATDVFGEQRVSNLSEKRFINMNNFSIGVSCGLNLRKYQSD